MLVVGTSNKAAFRSEIDSRSGDDNSANLKFESWWKGKPDCYVKFRHGKQRGQTQVEGNTFSPRFYETRKLKYQKGEGFEFQVWESDIIGSDRIVGRCWVSADKAKRAMKHDTPVLAKLGAGPRGTRVSRRLDRDALAATPARWRWFRAGAGIGRLKVLFTGPLPFADRQANLMGTNEKKTRKLMNDCYRRAHEKEDADETVDVD